MVGRSPARAAVGTSWSFPRHPFPTLSRSPSVEADGSNKTSLIPPIGSKRPAETHGRFFCARKNTFPRPLFHDETTMGWTNSGPKTPYIVVLENFYKKDQPIVV